MQVTTKQLAEKLGVDYVIASSLIKFIVKTGQGKECGKERTSAKPATIYELPDVFTISLIGGAVSSIPDASNPFNAHYTPTVSLKKQVDEVLDELDSMMRAKHEVGVGQ